MATGLIELTGAQIGSTGSNGGSGNDKTKVVDGDFATFFDAANASSDWVGIDAGAPVTVQRVLIAPRLGNDAAGATLAYENRVIGAKVQASSAADFGSDVTDTLTLPAWPPAVLARQFTAFTTTTPPSKRYWRYLGPASGRCNLAELRFLADAGVSAAKPCAPTISGHRKSLTGASTVALASLTTSASLYYTTDGTTPTTASSLYTAPFSLSIDGTLGTTLKVRAYDASLGTTYSDTTASTFTSWGFKAGEDWYDSRGILNEFHTISFLPGPGGVATTVGGWYYAIGSSANRYNHVTPADITNTIDGSGADGVWMYKTQDFLNWTLVGNILWAPVGSYACIRPHILYNASTGKYVIWAKTYTPPSGSSDYASIATADSVEGPWAWVTTNYTPPGASGFLDDHLFIDDDGSAYVSYTTYAGGAGNLVIQALASDYLTATGSFTSIHLNAWSESPVIVKKGSTYYCYFSHAANYYNSANTFSVKYLTASTPLGTWTLQGAAYAVDPVGGVYNGQPCSALKFDGGHLFASDYWALSDLYQSRYVFLPIPNGSAFIEPRTWDLREFGFSAVMGGRFAGVFSGVIR